MLKWYDKLYYSPSAKKRASKWMKKINQGKPVLDAYVITLSNNPANVLELVPAVTLVQEPVTRICPMIIGLAKGKEEGLELISSILEEVYEHTGSFRVEEYMEKDD